MTLSGHYGEVPAADAKKLKEKLFRAFFLACVEAGVDWMVIRASSPDAERQET